jgi:hypothetical protein
MAYEIDDLVVARREQITAVVVESLIDESLAAVNRDRPRGMGAEDVRR